MPIQFTCLWLGITYISLPPPLQVKNSLAKLLNVVQRENMNLHQQIEKEIISLRNSIEIDILMLSKRVIIVMISNAFRKTCRSYSDKRPSVLQDIFSRGRQ